MAIATSKLNTILSAKILTYTLNAYVDWQIAQDLKEFFKSGKFTGAVTVSKLRARQLVVKKSQLTNSYLIGLMYTQKYINGLVNYSYAQLFKKFLFHRDAKEALDKTLTTFHENIYQKNSINLCKTWLAVLFGNTKPIQAFAAKELGYTAAIKPLEVARACLNVQEKNSLHNLRTAKQIVLSEHSPDHKITTIQETALLWANPAQFKNASAATLRSAASWDKKLKLLLKLRYPMLHS